MADDYQEALDSSLYGWQAEGAAKVVKILDRLNSLDLPMDQYFAHGTIFIGLGGDDSLELWFDRESETWMVKRVLSV